MRYSFTYADVLAAVEAEISVGGTFTTAQETRLKRLIEMANYQVCRAIPTLKTLRKDTVITTTDRYTTGTVSIVAASASVTGSGVTWTTTMIGRKIRFGTESDYYTITAVSGSTITLDRVYCGTTDTDATYEIFQHAYDLPRDYAFGKEKLVRYLQYPDAWSYIQWDTVAYQDPALQDSSTPICYTILPFEHREPATGTNAMDAGSGTTTVIDSALLSSTDDYYNEWMLVNTTRGDTSRVSDYTGSSKTITNSPAITSQAVTDTYFLLDRRFQIAPYPILDDTQGIFIDYYKNPQPYDNAYDVPDVPEEAGGLMCLMAGALGLYYGIDPKAAKWQELFIRGISDINAWNNRNMNEMTRKEGYGTTNLSSREPGVNIPDEVPS